MSYSHCDHTPFLGKDEVAGPIKKKIRRELSVHRRTVGFIFVQMPGPQLLYINNLRRLESCHAPSAMDSLGADIRYAIRLLLKQKLFTSIAVLTLAVGIGANIAIFTLVYAVLLRPLPFHHPDRLVRIFDDLRGAGSKNVGLSIPELDDLRQRSDIFEQVSVVFPVSTALSGGDQVERIELLGTSPNYFELLGAKAAFGHVYGQADWQPGFLDGVVISDGLWKRQFGGDPAVLGKRIRVDE